MNLPVVVAVVVVLVMAMMVFVVILMLIQPLLDFAVVGNPRPASVWCYFPKQPWLGWVWWWWWWGRWMRAVKRGETTRKKNARILLKTVCLAVNFICMWISSKQHHQLTCVDVARLLSWHLFAFVIPCFSYIRPVEKHMFHSKQIIEDGAANNSGVDG